MAPLLLLREAIITIPKQNPVNNQILDRVRDTLIERFHGDFPQTPYVTEYEDSKHWVRLNPGASTLFLSLSIALALLVWNVPNLGASQ